MSASAARSIVLCADDYGMSPGVNQAIRDLVERRRINATSVMVVTPAIGRDEAKALMDCAADTNCSIGLHVTLSAPFSPLTMHFRPLDGGMFLSLGRLLRASLLRRLDAEFVYNEVTAQLAAFRELFGKPPDHVDGHQHVQLFPGIREGFIRAVTETAPDAWVRQCGSPAGTRNRNPKALLLDFLSAGFRDQCDAAGLRYNPAFTGAYDFSRGHRFDALMRRFLAPLPDRGAAMCHPGFVDDVLRGLDPVTDQREREHAFLGSEEFLKLLSELGVTLDRAA
jgi:chitin disaccharide deacetylase